MKKILFFVLIIANVTSFSQTVSQLKKQLKKDIKTVEKSHGKQSISAYAYNDYIKAFPDVVFNELRKYEQDTLMSIRWFVYDVYYFTAKSTKDSVLRQQIVNSLVNACSDPEKNLRERAAHSLRYFNKSDFSQQAKAKLAEYYNYSPDVYMYTSRLVGFLDMTDQIPVIQQKLNDSISETVKWELHLTLARLGVEDEQEYCTNFVASNYVNDRVIHYLFNDLIYTRSRYAFDYMIEQLNSDQPNCRPANPYYNDNIVCGYRIMELLAPVVKDFPYKLYPGTSQLKTNNYDKALQNVRDWFDINTDYVILKDKY